MVASVAGGLMTIELHGQDLDSTYLQLPASSGFE